MTDQWYIARDGQTFGPYTPEQVQELSRLQPFLPTDQMLRAGTQEWRPALLVDDLFAPAPKPEPQPAPEPPPFAEDEAARPIPAPDASQRRSRGADARVVLARTHRRGRAAGHRHRRRHVHRAEPARRARPPGAAAPAVRPAPETRAAAQAARRGAAASDRLLGPQGGLHEGPRRGEGRPHRGHADPPPHGYVNAKGKTIYHGKSEEFYPDSEQKKSEEWYAVGDRHGPAIAWAEDGAKTVEGQYFRARSRASGPRSARTGPSPPRRCGIGASGSGRVRLSTRTAKRPRPSSTRTTGAPARRRPGTRRARSCRPTRPSAPTSIRSITTT